MSRPGASRAGSMHKEPETMDRMVMARRQAQAHQRIGVLVRRLGRQAGLYGLSRRVSDAVTITKDSETQRLFEQEALVEFLEALSGYIKDEGYDEKDEPEDEASGVDQEPTEEDSEDTSVGAPESPPEDDEASDDTETAPEPATARSEPSRRIPAVRRVTAGRGRQAQRTLPPPEAD